MAYVPGVMPGKWFGRWEQRVGRQVPLRQLPLEDNEGLEALESGRAHLVMLRPEKEPHATDRERFHAVRLYAEKQVVILPQDHVLTLLEEVPLEELAEEFLLQDPQEVPVWAEISAEHRARHPRTLPAMRHLQDAVELVAAGLGLLVVPMSLARLHHRRDLTHRVVPELPETDVLLTWPRLAPGERPEEDEAVLQEFVGITRGRRPDSSRGALAPTASGRGTGNDAADRTSQRNGGGSQRNTTSQRNGGAPARVPRTGSAQDRRGRAASSSGRPTRSAPRSRKRRPGR